ncbi:MAG: hypothetical protein GWN84_14850 [Gammaproteobacteria bacterium]|nr:hypothetical protein [Gammaproteobacteria bacterium]NIR84078.1 hypothetical protein [Gammaproteobacteria bacterium]NIR89222.1 hypothetical protein [Gammaproteobacteria bacterium]NIU05024.1 hypothetical protein [Gammaproteobacteria bacterium]NIV52190.1 hypothetical protein [Gammaproteobacteria bacterium]
MRRLLLGVLAAGIAGMAPAVYGEVLLIEAIESAPPNSAEGLPRPSGGMKMQEVVERFGEPRSRLSAVGDPPITRWVYDDFTVYFEYEYTITTVVHRQQAAGN